MTACPSDERLSNFVEGHGARDAAFDELQSHLAECKNCRRIVAAALVAPLEPGESADAGARPSGDSETLAPAKRIGRYHILEAIGAGAMGVVYLAYDPELERKLAIKVLRHASSIHDGERLGERMLREAKAMAHASTSFTVAVYDAGMVEGRVFVAMELVDGQTLTRWLAASPRSWRVIVRLFAECGRALATAHESGIVHRDFKPDNVLVTREGHAKVTDFGLARPIASTVDDDGEVEPRAKDLPRALLDVVTQHGALVGTPAYMAPEQLLGGAADARSDQFSFCVALYEALVGKRPFAGKTLEELRTSVLDGRVDEALRLRSVPFGLRRAVLRGLSVKPEDRHASMRDLVLTLEKHGSRARLRWLFASLAATAGVAFAAARLAAPSPSLPCAHVAEKASSTWDASTRSRVRTSFTGTGRPFAEEAFAGVDRTMTEYLDAWKGVRQRTCEDTFVKRAQSEELFDLRMQCLDERWLGAQALVSSLSTADGPAVDSAVQAAHSLPALSGCDDAEGLRRRVKPPADPEARKAALALAADLATSRSKETLGRYAEAAVEAKGLVARAKTLAFAPALAKSLLLEGDLLERTGDYANAAAELRDAAWTAMAARDDETAIVSMAKLVSVVGYRLSREEEARFWDRTAEASLQARNNPPSEAAILEQHRGALARARGRYDDAKTHLSTALDLQRKTLGEGHPEIAVTENALAYTLTISGDYATAEQYASSAVALRSKTFGEKHPLVAQSRSQLGLVYSKTERYDDALRELNEALAIERATFGEDHVESGYTMNRIGNVHLWRGDTKAARKVYEDVLALGERRLGKAHPEVGLAHMNLAIALERMNLLDDAERELAAAKGILEGALGHDYPYLATVLTEQGIIRQKEKRWPEAERLLREALSLVVKTLGTTGSDYVEAVAPLAGALEQQGRKEEAFRLFEEASRHPAFERAEPYAKDLVRAWRAHH